MELITQSITEFVNEIDSSSPAPGGGSVSALAATIGVSLARMVGHLTVGKKAFLKLDEDTQHSFKQTLHRFLELKEVLLPLVDKDTEAFNAIMDAYGLAKDTEEQKEYRKQQIEEATLGAIEVPLQVASTALDALSLLRIIHQYGNKNCLSDIGVSALQLDSACKGALMNVKINASSLSNTTQKEQYVTIVDTMVEQSSSLANQIVFEIFQKL